MASNLISPGATHGAFDENRFGRRVVSPSIVSDLLHALASLKLTVVLFALAIFLVFSGTLAQVYYNIEQVNSQYFRTLIAWIDFKVFFPPTFFPGMPEVPGRFPFPGGFTIGGLMLINLFAAHGVRFKVQASGTRLALGLALVALGVLLGALVGAGWSSPDRVEQAHISTTTLWNWVKVGLAALWVLTAFALWRVDTNRKLESRLLLGAGVVLGLILLWLVLERDPLIGDASARILFQLILGLLVGVLLLFGCVLIFRKRGGIVLLHAGVALLMINELVVYSLHNEAGILIAEGETTNYVTDQRKIELAVIDTSPSDHDQVTVIPETFLKKGQRFSHSGLIIDVKVVDYMANSSLMDASPADKNLANAGIGVDYIAKPKRAATGTDMKATDLPAAYIELYEKGTDNLLGTYLFPVAIAPQDVKVGDKTYKVTLRFKRIYKPYTIELLDVRKDDYLGTITPQNYSSDIRLIDPTRDVDRKIHIWMNNPLRYAGETFYQADFRVIDGEEYTGLSVVENVGWMIPYLGCMIVGVGMLAQFSITLVRFIRRREEETTKIANIPLKRKKDERRPPTATTASISRWLIPIGFVSVMAAIVAIAAIPPRHSEGEMNLDEFGRLPIVQEGRHKPYDTLARTTLRMLSNHETFKEPPPANPSLIQRLRGLVREPGKKQPAMLFFLDLIADPDEAAKHRVIRVDHPELLDLLGLRGRKGYLYSMNEIRGQDDKNSKAIAEQMAGLIDKDEREFTIFERRLIELNKRISIYNVMQSSFARLTIPRFPTEEERKNKTPAAMQDAVLIKDRLEFAIGREDQLKKGTPPLAVPVGTKDWQTLFWAWVQNYAVTDIQNGEPNPFTAGLAAVLDSYAAGDVAKFNASVEKLHEVFATENPDQDLDVAKVNFEDYFNHVNPFSLAIFLYLIAFLISALAWVGLSKPLNNAAFGVLSLAFLVHTLAIIGRIYISGRPPVTTLHSANLFVGWGAVALGLALERIYRLGLGNTVAAIAGFTTLMVADFLANEKDTFTVMQAVLDTQFWLSTHVTTIALGYSTTFVAGLLGVFYVLRGVLTTSLSPDVSRQLARMIYGTLCFALFFSFVGTVLGGLWAENSWGRFWGWDPKENGALLIVLWNALILHARWDGIVRERGLALLAIFGNIVVAWSFYGTNQLGIGLHSYGFTQGAVLGLMALAISHLVLIAVGGLPRRIWRSSTQAL